MKTVGDNLYRQIRIANYDYLTVMWKNEAFDSEYSDTFGEPV
jgi:hypothetical protein